MMSEVARIYVKIIGKGGHGSEPSKCRDPIQPIIDIYGYVRELIKKYEERGKTFRLTLPHLQAGFASNVIPDTAFFEGTFRSFEEDFTQEFIKDFSQKIDEICQKYSCTSEKKIESIFPALLNTEKETEHIIRLAKEYFGAEHISNEILPSYASEDFSYYLKNKPGCYFFLGSGKTMSDGYLHTENFNFNDNLIPLAADFYLKIVEDRLGLDKKIFNLKNSQESLKENENLAKNEAATKIQPKSKKIKKTPKK